ncbi:MAG TPA: hypothetical protein VFY56_10490 [Propionibacteriaceae bacterium]|nr:hypothetical protein [Propionibacteriaceae bacterium]
MIKIAVDHGVVAAVGHTDASYDQTHAGTSAGAQTSRPLVSWAWATRISTGDPADLVVLDSTPDADRRHDRRDLDWLG